MVARMTALALAILAGFSFEACGTRSGDFRTFMGERVPSGVRIAAMDGNWGNDPWRCWQLEPADPALRQALISRWKMKTDPKAFNGVASGGKIYCRPENLIESWKSSDGSNDRAVGVDASGRMWVYFYNG